jgi:N-acetylglucosamine-6-phosphate deacetylase
MWIVIHMDKVNMKLNAIHYKTGEAISIQVEHGRIEAIESIHEDELEGASLPFAAPGLVDLQINGYAGYDFNQLPIPDDTVSRIIRELWQEGVTSSYPTVITNSSEAIHDAMVTISRTCDQDPTAAKGIAGIHLEGPFISPHDGARGAHRRDFVQPPDWEQFSRWQEAAGGRIAIVTLSPEWPDSIDFIAKCVRSGVTVSIGHTSATAEQIAQAVAAGARMSTHFGNGSHLMLPRHPNYLWEQLAQDDLWTCLIADGFHLPDQVLKVVLKVKGSKAMLVSDAVSLSGLAPGDYTTHVGGKVILTPEGKLHLAENDKILAGSAQMLLWGIEQLTSRGLASLPDAWDMSSIRPASFMQLPSASGLAVGAPADFVLFHTEGHSIKLKNTYQAGELVYQS